ncbi:MAG TPA: hypothetical protein GX406_02980 [Pseudoclavibacter sp.]|nr:hypothetical protein [Pseudoclavibacter sp.]
MRPDERTSDPEPFDETAFSQRDAGLQAARNHVVQLCFNELDFDAPLALREAIDRRPLPYTSALDRPALRQTIAGRSLIHVARARITGANIHDGSKHD